MATACSSFARKSPSRWPSALPINRSRRPTWSIRLDCRRPVPQGQLVAAYSMPFVLGTPLIRGSDSSAARRARAEALKMHSAM